jgi:hypothetical protein
MQQLQMYPRRRGQARRRRGGVVGGEQARGIIDWAHMGLIRVGGLAGEAPGDGRR